MHSHSDNGSGTPAEPIGSCSTCAHERSHIVDSRFNGGGYSCVASRRIFCDVCRLQRWLDIEVVLAGCQAELGIVPADAAERIRQLGRIELFDLEAIQRGIKTTGHSLVPLLREFERVCGGYAGQFIHHGATTQDIQDTGMMLEMRDVLDAVDLGLGFLPQLGQLAKEHRDNLMMGRTHAQPALPSTFGLKLAGWIDELLRHRSRLRASRKRILVAQLSGGVGTLAGFGPLGLRLLALFAERLDLGVPMVGWHVIRDRVAEFVAILAMLNATLARIADEIRILSRPEFQELEEHWAPGQIGSSTMPHKRNPEKSEQVVVLARLARAQVALSMEGMILEHERDYRGTRLEWPAVTDVSHYTLTALELLGGLLTGLRVHSDRMRRNVEARAEAVCTEALMLQLGSMIGKQRAFKTVHTLSQDAQNRRVSLKEVAKGAAEITSFLGPEQLETAFDPAAHLGSAAVIVEQVLARLGEEFSPGEEGSLGTPESLPKSAHLDQEPVFTIDYWLESEFRANCLGDLKEGCLRLRTSLPLRKGQRIKVLITFGERMEPLAIPTEVRTVEPQATPPIVEVAILDLDRKGRRELAELLRASSRRRPNPTSVRTRCLIFEKDEMLQQVYLQEVNDLTQRHGYLQLEATMVSSVEDWRKAVGGATGFDVAVVDLDSSTDWSSILGVDALMPLVLLGASSLSSQVQDKLGKDRVFIEKPLRFGVLLRTVVTILRRRLATKQHSVQTASSDLAADGHSA